MLLLGCAARLAPPPLVFACLCVGMWGATYRLGPHSIHEIYDCVMITTEKSSDSVCVGWCGCACACASVWLTVIDFCLARHLVCDKDTNYRSLRLTWSSKTNCNQRKGVWSAFLFQRFSSTSFLIHWYLSVLLCWVVLISKMVCSVNEMIISLCCWFEGITLATHIIFFKQMRPH